MRPITALLAISLIAASMLAPQASAQATAPGQVSERMLPMAAGALAGAAAAFFLLPVLVPATAVAATAGASATSGPLFAVVGAGVGGLIGYEYIP